MWLPKTDKPRSGSMAVAIDKDTSSQSAIRWTMENLASRGQTLALIHVLPKSQSSLGPDIEEGTLRAQQMEKHTKDLFESFHRFCIRKEINCIDVLLEDEDKGKAIVEYVRVSAIENLVLGASSRNSFMSFKTDLPTSVSKAAPDFCNVYVISLGKIYSVRDASCPAPSVLSELDLDDHEYSSACREALTARNEATELQKLKMEEEELKMSEETTMLIVEKEKAKAKTAMEVAEAANRVAEVEAKRRLNEEIKALKESDSFFSHSIVRYRKYSVQC